MVIDLLGPSLEDLFNYCNRKFSLKTVCMLAREMILRLQYVHSKNLLHRDIKPDNFTVGLNKDANVIFLIDYGLCKPYRNFLTLEHIPQLLFAMIKGRYRENKSLTGTPRYASLGNHFGMEQSRRDDLESLGYVLLYFLKGKLPWQGLRAETKEEKYSQIRDHKLEYGFEQLCQGFPEEFLSYFDYCHSLGFTETPDYNYLRNLFSEILQDRVWSEKPDQPQGWEDDGVYDWMDDPSNHSLSMLPKHCLTPGGTIRHELLKPAPKELRESMVADGRIWGTK